MNVEEFREVCLSLKGAKENAPWSEPKYRNLVTYTVGGKWFSLLDLENKFADLKAPAAAIPELQEQYAGCFQAWHMNKSHWIGVRLESDLPDKKIKELITESYRLVVSSLPRKTREELNM